MGDPAPPTEWGSFGGAGWGADVNLSVLTRSDIHVGSWSTYTGDGCGTRPRLSGGRYHAARTPVPDAQALLVHYLYITCTLLVHYLYILAHGVLPQRSRPPDAHHRAIVDLLGARVAPFLPRPIDIKITVSNRDANPSSSSTARSCTTRNACVHKQYVYSTRSTAHVMLVSTSNTCTHNLQWRPHALCSPRESPACGGSL
jgi:hypothetical protein